MKIKNKFELDYKKLLRRAINEGELTDNRTGVKTFTLFNQNLTIDLQQGFPILTGKKIFFDKAKAEYEWMIQGLTTLTYLHYNDVHWWDIYANDKGELGKSYGYQIRNFNGEIDQVEYINQQLRLNSRRAHMTLWNPSELDEVLLPPCFTGFTFMKINGKLNMTMQLRSSDFFLGLPYDIIVASLMMYDIAKFNEIEPNLLGIQITNAHIYENHLRAVIEYTDRKIYKLPNLYKDNNNGYKLNNYKHGNYIETIMNN